MLQFHWHCSSIGSGLVDRQEASNSGEAGLSELAAFPFSESIYAFIPWLCSVNAILDDKLLRFVPSCSLVLLLVHTSLVPTRFLFFGLRSV